MPQFAANLTMMFSEWGFLDRFAAAADAGFRAIEFLFPYSHPADQVATGLTRNQLVQALFNLPPGNWDAGERGTAAIPGREREFREAMKIAVPYVEATGVKRLHVMSGLADAGDPASHRCYEENLRFACDFWGSLGVDVLIEPINPRDVPGYFLNSFNTAVNIINRLSLPNLKLQFDIYHRQILHGDVMKGLETLLPHIAHVQTASVPYRNEPGTGELDDARVFAYLDKLGYRGYVGCEYRPANGTLAGLGWLRSYHPR